MKSYKQLKEDMASSVTTRQSSDQEQAEILNARKALSSKGADAISKRTARQSSVNKEKRDSLNAGAAKKAQEIQQRQQQQKQINQQKREGGVR